MIRKHDNLNKQKYCCGDHHIVFFFLHFFFFFYISEYHPIAAFFWACPEAFLRQGRYQYTKKQGEGAEYLRIMWHGGLIFYFFWNVRWLCPRIQFSVSGTVEGGSSWSRCSFRSSRGQMHSPACTDFALGACPLYGLNREASPGISAGVDVVGSVFPCTGCVSSLSDQA